MSVAMFGVVLWTDATDRRAVIWCEDHGDLAFYSGEEPADQPTPDLDAGDLIQFDLGEDAEMRRACNLRRVDVGYAKPLSNLLRRGGSGPKGDIIALERRMA